MSSDSDDDFSKIAQRLQSMKSNYQEDNIKTLNLLEDTNSINITAKKDLATPNNELPKETILNQINFDIDDSEEMTLDSIIEQNSKKRKTRSQTKNNDNDTLYTPDEPVDRGRRKRSKRLAIQERDILAAHIENVVSQAKSSMTDNATSPGRGGTSSRKRGGQRRGRGRGRGRGASLAGRRHIQNNSSSNNFVHYNIGNTDDYEDLSEQLDLFSSKPTGIIVIDESVNDTLDDSLDENEELSVKVYWQSCEIFKFMIRRFQKFTQIYDYFSSKENVTKEKLLFTYNDKMLNVDDTPDTINYNIGKFIDGGIVNQSLSPLKNKVKQDINGIKLKFQCQNVKKPCEIVIDNLDKLSVAFMKCAECFEKPIEKLKFYFDGDLISGKNTAKDLELEGDECIDVVIVS